MSMAYERSLRKNVWPDSRTRGSGHGVAKGEYAEKLYLEGYILEGGKFFREFARVFGAEQENGDPGSPRSPVLASVGRTRVSKGTLGETDEAIRKKTAKAWENVFVLEYKFPNF